MSEKTYKRTCVLCDGGLANYDGTKPCPECKGTGIVVDYAALVARNGRSESPREALLGDRGLDYPEADDLVLCESADGWSLHAPGATAEQIATGDAPYLIRGEGRPLIDDYERAMYAYKRVVHVCDDDCRSKGCPNGEGRS